MSDEKDKIKITIPEYSGEEFAPDAAPSNEPAAPVEEIKKAEKILTDNDEIAAFNKEVLGELEPPLVVHKKSDTSYDNNNNSVLEMNDTHIDDNKPTLTRHRFKKDDKKKGKGVVVVIFIAVVVVAVFAALYFTGNIPLNNSKSNSQSSSQTSSNKNMPAQLLSKECIFLLTVQRLTVFKVLPNRLNILIKALPLIKS